MEEIPLSWQLWTLVALLVVSGFFSIAETSMMALNRYRLRHLVNQGHRGAKRASGLLAQTDRLLGVILLCNNLVNAAAATLVSVITINLFGEDRIALGIGTLLITFLILIFSEITPKVIGSAYAERIALPLSYLLGPLLRVLAPVVWFVNLFVALLLWLLRIDPSKGSEPQPLSVEEIRTLVVESGTFMPKKHRSILVNLFDLGNITVQDIMVPRPRIESIRMDQDIQLIMHEVATSYHRRLAVFRDSGGEVIGILQVRKMLRLTQSGSLDKEGLAALLAEPYFIPATTPVLAQLQYFQENHERIALVVDEYGELMGLVTLEDIIEEIVGKFTTSLPTAGGTLAWDADGSAQADGSMPLRDINRALGLALPTDGPKTLNGLILEQLQEIPEAAVSIRIADVAMEIVHAKGHSVTTVRLFRPATTQRSTAHPT